MNLSYDAGLADCRCKLEAFPLPNGVRGIIVGNRPNGWDREISYEDARGLADELQMPYTECCVTTGEGFDEIRDLVKRCAAGENISYGPRVPEIR